MKGTLCAGFMMFDVATFATRLYNLYKAVLVFQLVSFPESIIVQLSRMEMTC